MTIMCYYKLVFIVLLLQFTDAGVMWITQGGCDYHVNKDYLPYDGALKECKRLGGCLSRRTVPKSTSADLTEADVYWIYGGLCILGTRKCNVMHYVSNGINVLTTLTTIDIPDCSNPYKSICEKNATMCLDSPPPSTCSLTTTTAVTNATSLSQTSKKTSYNPTVSESATNPKSSVLLGNSSNVLQHSTNTQTATHLPSTQTLTSAGKSSAQTGKKTAGAQVTHLSISTLDNGVMVSPTNGAKVAIPSSTVRQSSSSTTSSMAILSSRTEGGQPSTTNLPTTPAPTINTSANAWIQLRYHEYYVNYVELSYSLSDQTCRSLNASLAYFADFRTYFSLGSVIHLKNQRYWIGVGMRTTSGPCLYLKTDTYNTSNTIIGIANCAERHFSICGRPTSALADHVLNDTMFKERLQDMTVDSKSTRNARRRLSSSTDDRPTARAVGSLGVAMLVIVGATIVFLDLTRLGKCNNCRRRRRVSSL